MAQVMIVDDDRAIREMLRFALEAEGYTVTALGDGRRVVETLQGMSEPCVVLMDLMMPQVSGWDVCRALAGEPWLAQHAVAVMTAGLMAGDPCPEPARALLRKPFELEQVYTLVEALVTSLGVTTPASVAVGYGPAASVA
jgi:two-component system OmpR family response regulator